MRDAKLVAARMLTPNVRELTFDPGPDFAFVPGQWVSLRLPQPGHEVLSRSYSIASAPRGDGHFDVAVTHVEGGPGSAVLHAASPGDVFPMTHAQGFFTLGPVLRPVLLVATGTGVAPLRSMVLAAADAALAEPDEAGDERFVLVLGVRTEQDLLYRGDFEDLAARWPRFSFLPTLSRADEVWSGRRGYVQTHLPGLVAELGGDCDVYVCGLNRMIREVRAVLKEKLGFTRERIHTERYD
jgi:ferredoxin-NADP reductase